MVVTSNAVFKHKLLLFTRVAQEPPGVDMDGSSGTYWPVNSDQAVPELDLGWPLTFGFQGTEVTTLVQPPPPDSPSIKDEARRMIRSAQQVTDGGRQPELGFEA